MDMKNKIIAGHRVKVDFNGAQITLIYRGEVIYAPITVSDCWIIRCLDTDRVYYISEVCTIMKL